MSDQLNPQPIVQNLQPTMRNLQPTITPTNVQGSGLGGIAMPQFSPLTMALLQGSLPSVYGGTLGITPQAMGTMGPRWPLATTPISTSFPSFGNARQLLPTPTSGSFGAGRGGYPQNWGN